MNKAFWSRFKHFGDCWEKFVDLLLTPSKTDGEFPDSKVHLQPATWLTGKFLSKRMSRHYWPVWCGHRGKIGSSGRGGGELVGKWVWPIGKIHPFRHQIPSDTPNYVFPSNTFLPRTQGLNGPLGEFTKLQIDIWNVKKKLVVSVWLYCCSDDIVIFRHTNKIKVVFCSVTGCVC